MKKAREGYKLTEIGEISKEWEVKKLGEVIQINPPKPSITDNDKEISFIAMADVSDNGKIININSRKYKDVCKGYTGFQDNDVY